MQSAAQQFFSGSERTEKAITEPEGDVPDPGVWGDRSFLKFQLASAIKRQGKRRGSVDKKVLILHNIGK